MGSESLQIDLKHLSGEEIYKGDPEQIHEMLSLFEELWEHLFDTPVSSVANISEVSQPSMNSGVSGIGMDSSLDENELRKFGSPDRFDDISSPFKSGRHTPFISSNKTKSKVKTKSKTKKKKPKKLKSQSKIIEPTIPKSKPALPSKRIEKNQTRTKKRIIAPKKKNIVQRKPVVEKSETKKPIK